MKKQSVLLWVCLALFFALPACGQSGVNNGELSGNYAFTFTGVNGNGSIASVYGAVGRFTADGAGNLTNGEADINGVGAGASIAAQAFTGTYSIGADHRGVMTLNIGGSTAQLAFAMTANGNAKFIKFDASGGAGTIGSGSMEKADTTAFSTARVTGDYVFGGAGFDNTNNRASMMVRFTSNGTGVLSNAAGDVNAYGTNYAMNFTAANYAVGNTATGRGTMRFAFTFGGAPDAMNFVFYVVNSGKLFAMESDSVSTATPLLNGVVLQQHVPTGGFSNGSLNGNSVIYLTGHSQCGTPSGIPKAVAGLLTTNGGGALSLTYDENFCSAPNSVTAAPGSYAVASNGRLTMTIGGYNLVAYLVSANQLFLSVIDSNVLFGPGEPQTASALTNMAVAGGYAGVATNPVSFAVNTFSGEFAGDGASPGHLSGKEDIGRSTGTVAGASFASTYSITASPTNGRGTFNLTSPASGTAIAYVISPTKFVVVPMSEPNPSIWIFEQGPTSTNTVTLSSLSLNPTSVTGGTQSSTGTVTLSGAAPAGGAVVALSSSNTTVARTPSSVTVAAGATTATFAVGTSAVSAATAVTISASYAGATKTASLTVNPAAPPPVTLSSLSLNPTSVTGGVQSSTGTVTLSGAAPAGGAVVALSSSNTGAAQTPASVTVAAGTTSATFTVTTNAVPASTSVTIAASYAGTTRTALLTVNPVPLPLLTSMTVSPGSVVGGLGASTGTVRLSAPAPAGGSRVALVSNGFAASVPSSVLIAAGTTSATFPVNTSIVLISTTVNITASYNNTSRSASLSVLL